MGVMDLVVAAGGPVTTHRDSREAMSMARQVERDGALALDVAHGVGARSLAAVQEAGGVIGLHRHAQIKSWRSFSRAAR